MPETLLRAEGLQVTHGQGAAAVRALDDVSLELHAGRVHLVMGPSGSGKTTLLSVLGSLLSPDRGSIHLQGKVISGLPEKSRAALRRRHMGFIFQAFRLFRALTALENVMVSLDLAGKMGRSAARRQAREALDRVGLAGKGHRKPHELSGGEKQRVAIARAVVHKPEIVLADEPTAALDTTTGSQVVEILKSLARDDGRLVVMVSHDPRLLAHADHLVELQDGRVSRREDLERT